MNFADKLIQAIDKKESHACVGLDPRWDRLPSEIKERALAEHGKTVEAVTMAIVEFNRGLIDAVKDLVPVVKPQIAFYEQYGSLGIKAFEETIAYAKEQGLLVISDAKRNDIGSTAKAYAQAHLAENESWQQEVGLTTDSLTVTPYLGWDGIEPFINTCQTDDKGLFILVKTSNQYSYQLQDIKSNGGDLAFEKLAKLVNEWGAELVGERGYSSVGAVVGATYPQEAKKLRKLMKNNYFLVPGYGAQGGGADDVVPCFNKDGYGAVVNSSRGINFAYQQDDYSSDYQQAAQRAAQDMNQDINSALKRAGKLTF